MAQMPSGAIGAKAKLALQLQSRNAFLGAAQDGEGHQPSSDRQMGAFHHRADRHAELLGATTVALPHAGTMLLAFQFRVTVNAPTMRANNAIRPADSFQPFAGLVFGEF